MIGQLVKKWQLFFLNSRWRRPPSWICPNMHFRRHRFVPNRSPNVSINFGDDRSNSKNMAAVFRNPRWRQPPSWIFETMLFRRHRNDLNRSRNVFKIFLKIGQIVKKWQQFFEIQDGGGRHLELWSYRFFDVTDVFWIKVAIFPLNLAMIGQIVKKWQPFF